MSEKKQNEHAHPPFGEMDYELALLQLKIAAMLVEFESQWRVAVHQISLRRRTDSAYGEKTGLSAFPYGNHPYGPLESVLVNLAKGKLVGADTEYRREIASSNTEPPSDAEIAELMEAATESHYCTPREKAELAQLKSKVAGTGA
jgi:hypothetical protein